MALHGNPISDRSIRDPRQQIWNNRSYGGERDTWHSHGRYPKVADFSFYLSYHALMTVASELLASIPVTNNTSYSEKYDEWKDWLDGYLLVQDDGNWLSERRDATPTFRSSWIDNRSGSIDEWSLDYDLFEEALRKSHSKPEFLAISGH